MKLKGNSVESSCIICSAWKFVHIVLLALGIKITLNSSAHRQASKFCQCLTKSSLCLHLLLLYLDCQRDILVDSHSGLVLVDVINLLISVDLDIVFGSLL